MFGQRAISNACPSDYAARVWHASACGQASMHARFISRLADMHTVGLPGPIGAVITPQLFGLSKRSSFPTRQALCGACARVCPVKIDIPDCCFTCAPSRGEFEPQLRRCRESSARASRSVLLANWSKRERIHLAYAAARLAADVSREGKDRKSGLISRLVPPLGAWTAWRDAPVVASKSFREMWREKGK